MSRCCICNYSDYGLSDIPLDDRTITNDICSFCDKEIHPPKVKEKDTVGWMLSSDEEDEGEEDSGMPPEAPNLTAEWGLGGGELPIYLEEETLKFEGNLSLAENTSTMS